ncbi:P-loop containing nucleoside triphosphate hydrolase protein [Boletus reticuloceps]|uniref:P-loop containing nucleoside triphosphate hydrolase protein n=1 Tax=Boletus reticuloceps TaxID=495285 RepID=A0A8I3AEN8_9AGAM|nr:P-loop containing nucleoside triphosphate hydrolase protein [Boletus reticuloceps]
MNFSFPGRNRHARQSTTTTTSAISSATGASSPPDDNWETLDLSSSEYARRRREMMQLINDLRSLGQVIYEFAETLMDLPSIVVIGGQSAGKSSLVEAVSGVNVPRDSGTCTRCPMECTMSSSATTWSCRIKLRFDYDSSGRSSQQQKEISFGPTITDKNEVDIWLRRAQAAILNPNNPPESFHRKSIQELRNLTATNSLKFSRNVVSVFIEDPGATDLSFVDLPGLIQNEDEEVVELVRQLTEGYISRPNTIILTTIPMSDDMQNQQSVRMAKLADPEGERTIGILTKPDTLGDGAVNSKQFWLDVIEGRQHTLKHGYYCVRLPDDAQRAQHLSRAALQRIAADWFDATPPWSGVADRGRFGIPAFVTDISVLLVQHINRVIPQLKQDVERLLGSCLEEIGALPPPVEVDPQIEVLRRVNAFCCAFKDVVSGASSDKSLAQRNRALYTIFARDIGGTSPDFRPFEDPEQYMPIDGLDSEEHTEVRNDKVQIMGVYEVRKTIAESIAWELPGNIPYEAKTRLINQFTDLWFAPAEKCVASINDVLDDVIQQLTKTHFGQFKILQNTISDLIRPDIEEYKSKVPQMVKETLHLEIVPIYSQNVKDFQVLRGRWLNKYRAAHNKPGYYVIGDQISIAQSADSAPAVGQPRAWGARDVRVDPPEIQALRFLAQAGYENLKLEDLARLYPPDEFEDELVVMADVRAYFTIAYKRIIDHIPLKIHQSLHLALAVKLSVSLLQRLIVDSTSTGNFADRMKELVSEDPAIEAKRVQLETKRTRLQEMRRKLVNFAAGV